MGHFEEATHVLNEAHGAGEPVYVSPITAWESGCWFARAAHVIHQAAALVSPRARGSERPTRRHVA